MLSKIYRTGHVNIWVMDFPDKVHADIWGGRSTIVRREDGPWVEPPAAFDL